MKREKQQSFLHGAAILAIAGITVKILGACYKIPLGGMLGPVGMANFSIAYNIYALLFVISTSGVPAAISKMVSEKNVSSDSADIYQIYKVSYSAFALVGFIGFSVMFFGAEQLGAFMGSSDAAISIKAISPAVLFVAMSAINRGYFQGRSNMYPTAVSELIESFGKLIIGLLMAWYLKKAGFGESVVSAGAVFGVSAGAFLSALYFAFCRDNVHKGCFSRKRSDFSILKELLLLAVPITIGAAVISLSNVIDSALVMNLLKRNGFSECKAKWLYGAYSYATTIFNLPSALITTLAVSLLPALSGASAKRDFLNLDKTVNSGLAIAMMLAIPATCGMGALAEQIIYLLYGSSIEAECVYASGRMLACLSVAVVPLAIVTITNSIHQAMGNAGIPVYSMLAGAVVKLVSNAVLVGKPDINIYGAPVSTMFCYATIAIVNIIYLKKYPFIELNISKIFVKPSVMGCATFIAASRVQKLANDFFSPRFSVILSIFAGFLVCVICAFAVRAIDVNDKKLIFGRKRIFKFIDNG